MLIVNRSDWIGNSATEPGQPALAPGGSLTIVTGGTAHGVVGNGAAEAGQLIRTVTEGSGNRGAAGGRIQGVSIGLDAGQVTNTIVLEKIVFGKTTK